MKATPHTAQCLALLSSVSLLPLTGCTSVLSQDTATVSPTTVIDGHTYAPPVAMEGNEAPIYPIESRREGKEGVVVVQCVIDANGRPLDARIERSTNPVFNRPTLAAMRTWLFRPGTRDGVPVATVAMVPVGYSMEP